MTVTLTTLCAIVLCVLIVLARDANRRRARRHEREIMLRVVRYLDMSRPTRPW